MTSFTSIPPDDRRTPTRSASRAPLVEGPRWYRARIRTLGSFAALLVPAALGAIALISLRLFDGAASGAIGLVGGVFAAPMLLVVGAPFGNRSLYPWAVLASVLMWLVVGLFAARNATRNPVATWGDYWRHYAWLCAGVWLGAGVALTLAALSISDSLF